MYWIQEFLLKAMVFGDPSIPRSDGSLPDPRIVQPGMPDALGATAVLNHGDHGDHGKLT